MFFKFISVFIVLSLSSFVNALGAILEDPAKLFDRLKTHLDKQILPIYPIYNGSVSFNKTFGTNGLVYCETGGSITISLLMTKGRFIPMPLHAFVGFGIGSQGRGADTSFISAIEVGGLCMGIVGLSFGISIVSHRGHKNKHDIRFKIRYIFDSLFIKTGIVSKKRRSAHGMLLFEIGSNFVSKDREFISHYHSGTIPLFGLGRTRLYSILFKGQNAWHKSIEGNA